MDVHLALRAAAGVHELTIISQPYILIDSMKGVIECEIDGPALFTPKAIKSHNKKTSRDKPAE